MATVKNVGLSPINRGDVQRYTAQQSPAFRQEFWDKMEKTNDIDYYLYMLGEADKKGITAQSMNMEGLEGNIDDQWAEFYKNVAASSTEVKDYGEGYGEMTEKDYLTKVLDQKREYNAWLIEEAQIKAEKEAMSGWDKFWAGTGHFFVELGYSLEEGFLSIADFITNYNGGAAEGFTKSWRENLESRQQQLADWERRYSFRDVETWEAGFGATLVIGAANTLGLMLPAMVTNKIKPGAGMWTMYSTIFAENVFEARNNPNLTATEGDIILRATLQTGVEVFVEKALGSSMLDDLVLGTGRATKEFVKVSTWSGVKVLTKEVAREAAEEFFQELGSAMVNMVLSLDNEEWSQYNSETLVKDLGIAALLGGIFSGTRVIGPEIIKAPIKAVQAMTGTTKAGDIIATPMSAKVTVPGDTKVDTTTKPEVPAKPEQAKVQEYHRMNMFERLAMKINLDTFFRNINEAKAGNLTSEARQTIYQQAMMLGKIFQGLDAPQILRSMKLLKSVENYAKREGAKQEKIDQLNEGYLQSIVTEVRTAQKGAAIKFYGKKITAKEASKLAKEARITKVNKVINQQNVNEQTKIIEEIRQKKDVKPKARKTMIKATTTEGKLILPTDGQSLEVIEDNILIPEAYLEDGNPTDILRDVVEKDIAQEFVLYMRSPKRLVGWTQAKAALVKAYPEMNDYSDQQIARNILFNKGGAYALVSNLPNSDFNILFLNTIEGIRQVIYKTEVYGAAKQNTLKLVEGNFRYAARMYCLDNLGVNPHDLHNVLTKVDQMFIKNERAKIEYKTAEIARASKKVGSVQNLWNEKKQKTRTETSSNKVRSYEKIRGYESLSYQEYVNLFDISDPKISEQIDKIKNFYKGTDPYILGDEGFPVITPLKKDTILYRGVNLEEGAEQASVEFIESLLNQPLGSNINLAFPGLEGYQRDLSLTVDNSIAEDFAEGDEGSEEGKIVLRLLAKKGTPIEALFPGFFVYEKNAYKFYEDPSLETKNDPDDPNREFADHFDFGIEMEVTTNGPLLGKIIGRDVDSEGVTIVTLEVDSKEYANSFFTRKTLKEKFEKAKTGDKKLTLYSGSIESRAYGLGKGDSFNRYFNDLKNNPSREYITPPGDLWATDEKTPAYGLSNSSDNKTIQWEIEIRSGAPTPIIAEGSYVFQQKQGLRIKLTKPVKAIDSNNLLVKGYISEDTIGSGPKQELKQEFSNSDLRVQGAGFTTPEYENETYKLFQGILRKSLTTMEQANTSLKEVINNPEMYLKQGVIDAIVEKYGDTSKDSVYRFLRTLFIDETDGTKTISQSENGDSYYFADVTPVKKWNTAGITKVANRDPDGRSLFDTYKGQTVNVSEFWRGEALVGSTANVVVEFKEGGGTYYSSNQNKIFFDLTNKDIADNCTFLFALNHEFQHALQTTNRTAGGFALGLIIPTELVAAVKAEFPKEFKANMTPVQEMGRANQVIYKYSGEMEANQHATDYDFGQFVIAVKGDKYVIFTPKGAGPFEVDFKQINKAQKGAPDLTSHKELKRIRKVPKYKAEQSNLKYFIKKGKSIRIHPDLQSFIIEASNLNMLEQDVANMIKDASITYQKLMKWFKETPNINNYTFKHMQQSFWPDSPITNFEALMKVTSTITFDLDDKGNFKEVKFRLKDEEFTINDDAYRVAVMDHWTEGTDMNTIRKLVGATEILRRTITFAEMSERAKKSTDGEIGDIQLGVTEDFVDALLNNSTRAKKEQALRGFVMKQIAAKALEGKMTYDEAKKILNKYTIEFFEDLSDNDLDRMYVKHVLDKEGAKVKEEVINKALERNRKNAIANIKRLGTTIWNNTTIKNRKRLPADTFLLFTEEGKIRQEAYKGKSQVDILRLENLLRDTAMKARRGDYSSDETQKAYESLEKTKKQVEKLKGKAKTQVVNTTKVVTEYVTQVKTEAKIIEVKTTKANTPIKLEQLLATNFTKKRMSQMQEMENSEYHVSAKEEFRTQNQTLLDSITEAEWIDIVEWFEQSEFVGTEIDLGNFKAIRMYILADLVSRIKTHNIVMSNTWVNRINNLLSKNVHSSAVEMVTWSKVLNTINPYRQLAQEYNVSEEALDDIQSALESDNDEELAKAIDRVKKEIADNYVEKNMMEKLLAFRYSAMLSSPMTWLRNLVSNFIVKHFHKWGAGIGEKLIGKKMSKYKGYKLVGTKVTTDVAEFIKLNLLDSGLLHQLTEGYSKYDPYTAETAKKVDKDYIVRTMINNFNNQFEQEMVYGTSKISPLFVKFSKFVRKMISDERFVNEATLRYFGKILTEDIAEGRLSSDILHQGMFTKEVVTRFADAQWLAMGDYMKNANFMTKAMGALNENRFARYIMPLIIPFAQSSWNWWVETMRYSPFGLGEAIIKLVRFDQYVERMDKKRESSKKGQSASVQSSMLDKFMATRDLGKGVIGTFLWTTGIILASAGIIGLSRNADDKYVLKVGNVEVNVDPWFGSSTLLAGAALVGAIKDDKWQDMFNVTIDQMAQTLFITDILSSFKYGGPGKYVTDLPMNVLYSFIPNFIKMISTNVQVYKVKYDKGILGDLERFATGLVPGLSYAFPHDVDPFTGKKKIHKIPVLTQFGGISYNDISQAEREAAIQGLGLGQLTGEITVNGEKVYLNAEKVNIYRGEYTNQFIMALINDEVGYNGKRYSRMTKDEKKAALQNAISRAASYAKIKVWTEMGNKYYAGATLYNALKSLGIQNVYQGSGGYIKK